MDALTLTPATVTLTPAAGGAPVAAAVTVSADRSVATLDPAAALAATEYRATVTTGAADAAGNPLPAADEWTFTTLPPDPRADPDRAAARRRAAGVPPAAAIVTATFSEAMDPATLTATTFRWPRAPAAAVAGSIVASAGNTTFTLDPDGVLAPSTAYAVTVTTGAGDVAGNPLAARPAGPSPPGRRARARTRTEITTGEMLGAAFNRRWFYVRQDGGAWEPTYADGLPAARGKLMNFRAANAIWDDEARSDDDPQENTDEFVSHFDAYRDARHPGLHGLAAGRAARATRAPGRARSGPTARSSPPG